MPVTDRHVREFGLWVEQHLEEIVDGTDARLREDVPEYFEGAASPMFHANRQSITANVTAVAAGLSDGRHVPASVPAGAVDEVLLAAREGISWTVIDRTYRAGHAYIWERALQEIGAWELSPEEQTALLRQISTFFFDYMDLVTVELSRAYDAERQRMLGRRERRRVALVRDALAGVAVDSRELGYDLSGRHLGVVAWGADRERAIATLGEALGAPSIAIAGQDETVWTWFAVDERGSGAERALAATATGAATGIGVGSLARGSEGFRQTHRQARQAAELGSRFLDRAVVRYEDVALEALLMRDETAAREFAHRQLAELAGDDDRSRGQRETLRAYFAAGNNGAAAAARLGVHERTVGYRLAAIEERLGSNLVRRRDELSIALRILAVLRPDDER